MKAGRLIALGLAVGFLLNVTGWLGNNLLLGSQWSRVVVAAPDAAWQGSLWREAFTLLPDFVYGLAIVWLCFSLRMAGRPWLPAALQAGTLVAIVGGVTTYFAVANSGFIPWSLALWSWALVLATKLPLAIWAGWLLERWSDRSGQRVHP